MDRLRVSQRIHRRTMLALPLVATLAARDSPPLRHIRVYAEKGRFGGWPANHGIWNRDNEIVCGLAAVYFIKADPERHQRDRTRPDEPYLARSLDGGESWVIERPASLIPPEQGGLKPVELREALDFTAGGFALTLRSRNANDAPSYFWHSNDRGRHWQGPFAFPPFGRKGFAARTDYQIYGKREALLFATAAKEDGREGRPFCARTTDGGLTWNFQGWIGPGPKGFSMMPSSVMLPGGRLLFAVRVRQDESTDWINRWASDNQGTTWKEYARPVTESAGKGGNPPSFKRLPNGHLCITHGYKNKPYGIHATLSDDVRRTWTPPIVLRNDGEAWDLGYTRDTIRADGRMVTVYYWSPGLFAEREIVATIWDPQKAASGVRGNGGKPGEFAAEVH